MSPKLEHSNITVEYKEHCWIWISSPTSTYLGLGMWRVFLFDQSWLAAVEPSVDWGLSAVVKFSSLPVLGVGDSSTHVDVLGLAVEFSWKHDKSVEKTWIADLLQTRNNVISYYARIQLPYEGTYYI